ncbi:MAG TPA: SGNH/GDSL hydrolase family protein [Candidatus Acidoferrales bacterium]|nr:SGNH/GDSL hydrolase family protein [Candidatus Acidoferrales bacterium]
MAKTKSAAVFPIIIVAILVFTASAQGQKTRGHWVSAWSAAVHAPLPFPDLPPSPTFDNQTIRMVVRPTIGGERLRVRFSNEFGTAPTMIGAAHVALVSQGAKIVPESDRVLTFDGKPSTTIPPGSPMLSDPVDLNVAPFAEIAISIYLPAKTPASSTHYWAQHETYISGPGDSTAKGDIPGATLKSSWYWLADVEVWASDQTAATVTLGDSITDGVGAKQGEYSDWPDFLASRLAGKQGSSPLAVLNEGIGGNRILHDGAGVSALARFDRDVLAQPGVINLVVLEGINDIGWPHMKPRPPAQGTSQNESPFASEAVSAQDLIAGLQQMIERAHEHRIRAFGATLTPFEGADYYSADGEVTRQAVNQWIRTSGAFDGVFDFDAAVRDPNHPSEFREDYQSGDHLHPSAAGYKAMADAINLSLLRDRVVSP